MDLKENRITVRELLATVAAREVLAPGTSGYLRQSAAADGTEHDIGAGAAPCAGAHPGGKSSPGTGRAAQALTYASPNSPRTTD